MPWMPLFMGAKIDSSASARMVAQVGWASDIESCVALSALGFFCSRDLGLAMLSPGYHIMGFQPCDLFHFRNLVVTNRNSTAVAGRSRGYVFTLAGPFSGLHPELCILKPFGAWTLGIPGAALERLRT